MPLWVAIVLLGIVEGVTELLPVSSTGHLLIAEHWLPRQSDLFNIVIQCGAVIAILPLFRHRLARMAHFHKDAAGRDYALKLAVAFVITAIGGFALEKGGLRLPETLTPVAAGLIVGGVLFLVVEAAVKGRVGRDDITWAVAAGVGLAQLLAAVFPGTSRSGATIVLMLALGVARPAATEFAFLVGIPTILAAGGYKLLKAFHAGDTHEDWGMVALGTVVSGVVSFAVVKWLLGYVKHHSFAVFGVYRIVAGLVLLALVLWSPG